MTNKVLSFLVLLLCVCAGLLPAQGESGAGDFKLTVTGANNSNGVIRVALYNSKDSYAADKHNIGSGAFRKEAVAVKNSTAECTFKDLPFGQYAIKVFHDEDNSGNFYTGAFGIPKVQYGFSNNAKGMMGPASFNKAMFDFEKPENSMTVELSK
jgi:uncharacterized protein (DUF2141 family)